jgi:hypothetical protein
VAPDTGARYLSTALFKDPGEPCPELP